MRLGHRILIKEEPTQWGAGGFPTHWGMHEARPGGGEHLWHSQEVDQAGHRVLGDSCEHPTWPELLRTYPWGLSTDGT